MHLTKSSAKAVEPLEESHPHTRLIQPRRWKSSASQPANIPPTFEGSDNMVTVEAEVDAGSRANQRWEYDQLLWGCRSETGGRSGGGEGASDNDAILSTDDHKRTRISHGGGARRRRLRDDKKRVVCDAYNFFP